MTYYDDWKTHDAAYEADSRHAGALEQFEDEARDNLFAAWCANKQDEQWDNLDVSAHIALMASAIKAGADQSMIGQRLIDLARESLKKFVAANLEDECESLLQHAILMHEIDAAESLADSRDDR